MNDKMYYFLVGFSVAILIAMIILSFNPSPQTELVCGGCGSPDWWSIIAEEN